MGGRGAFVNVDLKDFRFNNGSEDMRQTFHTIGEIDGVQIIVREKGFSVGAPEYSHSASRIYAIVQKGKLKHLVFYDENHKFVKSIDFGHKHGELKQHVHYDYMHRGKYGPPTEEDLKIIRKIERWYSTEWQ